MNIYNNNNNNNNYDNNIMGGEVIAAGGFGCVFSPGLLCQDETNRKKGTVSKLMNTHDANDEYKLSKTIENKVKKIPNYGNYFVLKNTVLCNPKKLTQGDLKNYTNKCKSLQKHEYTLDNINNKIDDLRIINMPNAGLPVDEYMESKQSFKAVQQMSKKLVELFTKAIVPMNNMNLYHNDIKDSNILVQEKGNRLYARLTDWGLSCSYVPDKNSEIPAVWKGRPIQYNTPYSIIICNTFFINKYTKFYNKSERIVNRESLTRFVKKYIYEWSHVRGPGHVEVVHQLIKIISNEDPKKFVESYIVEILMHFNNNENIIANMREYLDTVFIKNVDKWGFVTSYYPILYALNTNKHILGNNTKRAFNILKELFYYTYTTSASPIDENYILDSLDKFNDLIIRGNNKKHNTTIKNKNKTTSKSKGTNKTKSINKSKGTNKTKSKSNNRNVSIKFTSPPISKEITEHEHDHKNKNKIFGGVRFKIKQQKKTKENKKTTKN